MMDKNQNKEEIENYKTTFEFLQLAGDRYWTASLLPALVGTTLPFWLNPPGFTFKWFEAVIFLFATLLFHTGFALLYACFRERFTENWTKTRLFWTGIICLLAVILLGILLNNSLQLNENVHEYIFIIFGITAFFIGVLYVVPPFSFFKRVGGEVIISVGLGMIPILGAYLIQTGDLTRTVYLASLPIVVSTGLWVWISELISKPDDKRTGHRTMVMIFPFHFAGRIVPILLVILIYASLVLAVFGRSSLNPLSLIALLSSVLAIKIVTVLWNDYEDINKMFKARSNAGNVYLIICLSIITSSLITLIY